MTLLEDATRKEISISIFRLVENIDKALIGSQESGGYEFARLSSAPFYRYTLRSLPLKEDVSPRQFQASSRAAKRNSS